MKFSNWIKKASSEEIRRLAKIVECHHLYLYQIVKSGCSAKLAKKIETATTKMNPRRIVRKHELRPDIWKKGE